MVRKRLKELADTLRPEAIRPEMYADPLMRKMQVVREKARAAYRKDILSLLRARSLTDGQLSDGRHQAWLRYEKALEAKLKPLEARFEREVRIPMLIQSGVLNKSAESLLTRR